MIKVKFHANWCSDREIREHFNRCTVNNDYTWKDLLLTLDDNYDFFVIMNQPRHNNFDPTKTIIFQSEPAVMRKRFGSFAQPEKEEYLKVYDIKSHHYVDKWYLNLNYQQLLQTDFAKSKIMSGIISSKNLWEGQLDRLNFLRYLDQLNYYQHFGKGHLNYLKSYQGQLTNKEDGLIPYKYHFNSENYYEKNYFTEKIIDPILCECLCFYDGCPNINEFLDPRAYIKINLKEPEKSLAIINSSINNNAYQKRLTYIKKEKNRLMNEMNPLNIVYKIIRGDN